MTLKITADQADDLLDVSGGKPGETVDQLTYVTTIKGDQRRWMQGITIVVSDPDGAHWGLSYDHGLTENQDSEYPWRGYSGERKDVELTRMYAHTITKAVYRATPPGAAEKPGTPDIARQVLDLALPDNDSGTDTVRGYLTALLALVWEHEQGFNGKRPFGNSGWQDDLYAPLVRAGLVEGSFDEDGHLEAVDAAAEQLIQAAIDELGKATA